MCDSGRPGRLSGKASRRANGQPEVRQDACAACSSALQRVIIEAITTLAALESRQQTHFRTLARSPSLDVRLSVFLVGRFVSTPAPPTNDRGAFIQIRFWPSVEQRLEEAADTFVSR